MTILGISIGTTRTGVCVLKEGELLEWQIHDFPDPWSDHKLRIIINRYKRYIRRYKVTAIVVKIPPVKKHENLAQIRKRIEALAKKYNCSISETTKRDIKHKTNLKNTNSLIEFARLHYPVLLHVFEKGIHNNHTYYKKLYEAVLSAHLFKEEMH